MAKDGGTSGARTCFARVRARLKAAVGEDVFNSWFARLELEEIVDDLAHLSVPTRFLCSWIQSNYADKILEAFRAETTDDQAAPFHRPGQRPGPSAARPSGNEPRRAAAEPAAPPGRAPIRETSLPPRRCALGQRARSAR